jgi:hypothetical protein
MKIVILAVFAALNLSVAGAQVARAANLATPQTTLLGAQSDNVDFGPSGSDSDGGWG